MKMHPDNAPFKKYDVLFNDYWNEILSISQIADKYSVNVTTIKYWFYNLQIPSRSKKEQGKLMWNTYRKDEKVEKVIKVKALYKNYETLYKDHWDSKLSFVEIANKYNIHPGTVQYWFKILNVPTRSKNEAVKLARDNGKLDREYEVKMKLKVNCSNCNKIVEVWNYRVSPGKDIYCSKKCKGEHWSKTRSGENAFNWKGGHWSENVSKRQWAKYKKAKKEAHIRDNHTCQLCGSKKKLVAHHIKSVRDHEELIFDVNNLITLCERCHVDKVNFHETEYEKLFTDIVAKAVKSVNLLT